MNSTKKAVISIFTLFSLAICVAPTSVTQAVSQSTVSITTTTIASPLVAIETLHMRITAYTSLPDETDSTPFITADGEHVRDGIVATNLLPFGTRIEIPLLFGDKIFTVEDRMSPVFKNTIDIWMPTYQKAIYFGLNYADVVVVSDNTLAVNN